MAVASPPVTQKQRRLRWSDLQEHLTGYLFILPAVLLVALFGLFPIGYAFYWFWHFLWLLGIENENEAKLTEKGLAKPRQSICLNDSIAENRAE